MGRHSDARFTETEKVIGITKEMGGKNRPCCHLQEILPNKCLCVPERSEEEKKDKRERISEELERRIREAFAILDRDCDGAIKAFQLETVLRMAGMSPLGGNWNLFSKDDEVSVDEVILAATDRWNDESVFDAGKEAFFYYGLETFASEEKIKTILTNIGVADVDEATVSAMVREAQGHLEEDLARKFQRSF